MVNGHLFTGLQRQIVFAINRAIAKKGKASDYKKLFSMSKELLTAEQWEQFYWLYKEDGSKEVANAIVAHALEGKIPDKVKPPLHVTFYWASQRIKKEILASLPLGEGRNNFNDSSFHPHSCE